MSLRAPDGSLTPLVPVTDSDVATTLQPARALSPNTTYDVVFRACPNCVCEGCAVGQDGIETGFKIAVGAGDDQQRPARPVVIGFDEDVQPIVSNDACSADTPALIVHLKAGSDDQADAVELRYGAVVEINGNSFALGDGHLASRVGDTLVLRIPTLSLPRLLGVPFVLTLSVSDLAGNSNAATVEHSTTATPGCGAAPAHSLWALALCLLARRRR